MLFTLLESLPADLERALEALRQWIAAWDQVVVAYSGGVDSALVAALAVEVLQERALAITGVSPALAPHLRQEARDQAAWLGLRHQELATAELADPAYAANPEDRCYACKRELHRLLAAIAAAAGAAVVLDGVNRDDLGDHRPGIRAAREQGVRSPLAELGVDKAGVRQISRALGLPWWDKPAQPCLASRFPYGEPISAARLERVAAAEAWLRRQGFDELRVRSQGETARIELPADRLTAVLVQLAEEDLRNALVAAFSDLGFSAVGLDLEGLVSGKLNRVLADRPAASTPTAEQERQTFRSGRSWESSD
ncbi:MAG: ATP-dependent sacrificial sulfur transferase LarE [Cyanobium sp.]